MTQEQHPEALVDGAWYWVEKETWAGEQVIVAPACYDAESNAWYSRRFSGISTRFIKVLEPCVRPPQATQAYRLLRDGEDRIEANDEFLKEDGTTWVRDPAGIFVGMPYHRALLPCRRRIG